MKVTSSQIKHLILSKDVNENNIKNNIVFIKNTNLDFKINISDEGKKLARQINTDITSGSTEELNSINKKKKYQGECKERIKELEKVLSREDITDDEREKLVSEKEFLAKVSHSSEDALYEAYKQKNDFNNSHNLDKCASSDVAIIDEVNSMLDKIIQEKKDVIRSESEHIQSLQHKQIQENGDIESEKHKNQPQNMKITVDNESIKLSV